MSNYLNQESNRDPGVGFKLVEGDIFEVSFDAYTSELVFRKENVFNISIERVQYSDTNSLIYPINNIDLLLDSTILDHKQKFPFLISLQMI